MKTKLFLSASLSLLFVVSAFAQPSKQQVINRIKSGNPKIIKVSASSPDRRIENGVYKYFFTVTSHIKTDYPGITRVYTAQDIYAGNNYERSTVGNDHYLGIPDPDLSQFEGFLNSKMDDILGTDFNKMIGSEEPKVSFPEDNHFRWGNLNSVKFLIETEYETMNDVTREVTKIRRTSAVRFSRSEDGVNWDPKAKYLPNGKWILDKSKQMGVTTEDKTIIDTRTAPESEKIVYYADVVATQRAAEKLASLPKIEIPEFKNYYEVIQFVHDMVREGSKEEIESMLYKMGDPYYFAMYEEKVINSAGKKFFNEIIEKSSFYSDYFCQYPQVKHDQEGMVQFYARDLSTFNRIKVYQNNEGNWVLNDLDIPGKESNAEAMAKHGDANCGEQLVMVELIKYNIGDEVIGTIRGKQYSGKVEKLDNMMDDRYFVRFDGTSAQWITGEKLQPGQLKSTDKPAITKTQNPTKNEEKEDKGIDAKGKLKSLRKKIKID